MSRFLEKKDKSKYSPSDSEEIQQDAISEEEDYEMFGDISLDQSQEPLDQMSMEEFARQFSNISLENLEETFPDLPMEEEPQEEEETVQDEEPEAAPRKARSNPDVQKYLTMTKELWAKVRSKFNTIPVPGWLFMLFMAVFSEIMVHFWVMNGFSFGRFLAVVCFALGFGCLLGTVTSFFSWKGIDKWVAGVLGFLLIVLYLVEYFVSDTYQTFMTMASILNGAEGVATGFSDDVIIVIFRGMGRILLFLLPWAAYLLFGKSTSTSWRTRYFITIGIVAAYLAGYGIVQAVGTDVNQLKSNYNFDSAVRTFGLNTALGLDMLNAGAAAEEEEFVIVDVPQPTAPVETTPVEEVPGETEPVVDTSPNVLDIDFSALADQASAEGFKRVATLHNYVSSVQPSNKNEYTGLFKGKNLIVVVAEAFAKEVIDPELTPTLYRLANEGIKFHDYYQPMWAGSTSSGEYSVLTGLVASRGTASVYEATEQDLFFTMGKSLQREGYNSFAYHNHLVDFYGRNVTHTHFGYDSFMAMGNGMEKGVQERWPQSDLEMIDFTVPQFIDKQPFNVYYMTVSGHCRYNRGGNKMSNKNYDKVKDLDTSEGVKCYIAANLELENAMASLVKQLEDAGIADDTVIVLSTDHYPYGLEWDDPKDIERLYGFKYRNIMERDHSALILWSGCIEDMDLEITSPTYSLDILPTLSNLFGLEYDSRLLVGRDVFSDTEALVLSYTHTWITEKGMYNAETGKFTPKEGVEVEDGYVERIAAIVSNKIKYSREAASIDYFNYVSRELFPEKWEKKK